MTMVDPNGRRPSRLSSWWHNYWDQSQTADVLGAIGQGWNWAFGSRDPLTAPASASAPPRLVFGSGASPAPATPAPRAQQPVRLDDFIKQNVEGAYVTSADRSRTRQNELIAEWEAGGRRGVRPADNSWHLQAGRAVDLRKTPGMTLERAVAPLRAAGWTIHEALDEGDHFHIAASPPGQEAGSAPRGQSAGPAVVLHDPRGLASMIPDAQTVAKIDLPGAPQMALPEARPLMEELDKAGLMAPLQQAYAVEKRDTSNDPWERVQGMLTAAAGAAGSVDPANAGLGAWLLAAGGGAGAGFQDVRGEQRELDEAQKERERMARIALAQAGFDIDVDNTGTRNTNRNIQWQSGEDVRATNFQNALSADERLVQELMTNLGIDQFNTGQINDTNRTRGGVAINATQDNVNIQNQASAAGWEKDAQQENALFAAGLDAASRSAQTPGAQYLSQVGIPLERQPGEAETVANARVAAGLIAAGNVSGARDSLATEIVLTGRYAEVFDEGVASQIENAIQQGNPQAAAMIAGQALREAPPEAVLEAAKKLSGNFVADMFSAGAQVR